MTYRIGIDVGGTHTDAALLDVQLACVAAVKVPTTSDVMGGIASSVEKLLAQTHVDPNHIGFAMLGTTHCTNAIVERRGLMRVGLLRLAGPATRALPPLSGWPAALVEAIAPLVMTVPGGFEYDGRVLSEIDPVEIEEILLSWFRSVDAIAVCGVFANVNNSQEQQVAELIRTVLGDAFPVTLSSEVGTLGLLERENAAVLNASLGHVAAQVTDGFLQALRIAGLENARAFIGQNDGTLMSLAHARKYPVLTIGCGPTNSLRGAAYLSGELNAVVIDVGGTTADVGVISNGFPRQSAMAVEVGGIRTNFRMPDILSIALGGGTVVRTQNDVVTLGPDSVGYKLSEMAQIFGGPTLTFTDVAVSLGVTSSFGSTKVFAPEAICEAAYRLAMQHVDEAVDRMKTGAAPVPVLLVGGGSILLSERIAGASTVTRPKNFDSANAIGVAIGEISAEIDRIVDISANTRTEVLERLRNEARAKAIEAGANPPDTTIIRQDITPLAYLPGSAARVFVKAAGRIMKSVI